MMHQTQHKTAALMNSYTHQCTGVPRTHVLTLMTKLAAFEHAVALVTTTVPNPGNTHPITASCAHLHEIICIVQWCIKLVIIQPS